MLQTVQPLSGRIRQGSLYTNLCTRLTQSIRLQSTQTRAAVCTALGSPLTVKDFKLPDVGSLDVKVRVQYSAINYADILMCAGQYQVCVVYLTS